MVIGTREGKRKNHLRVEVLVCAWPGIAGCVFGQGLGAGWRELSSGETNSSPTLSHLHTTRQQQLLLGAVGKHQLGMAESRLVLWDQVSSGVGLGCALELQKLPHSGGASELRVL